MSESSGVARQYRDFARQASGQSDCFEQWAEAVAGDEDVLAWIAALPEAKQQPNLVFAAGRWNGVPAPGPYAGLREALLNDRGDIRDTIITRSTQTNEVGRLATLVPAMSTLAAGQPVALLEVGASAGLCLYPDRYDYDWWPTGRLTGSGGPTLSCDVVGAMPVPDAPLHVTWRGGIDLNPLDVTDDEAMDWLTTLVWPEQEDRRRRLRDAIAMARDDPPVLVRGDLVDKLPQQIDEAAEHGTVVVFHSAVIAYLNTPDRATFAAVMNDLVAAGRCRWISNEGPRVLPEVTSTAPDAQHESPTFVLGVDGRAVARTHPHGAAMRWVGP
ncbi:MAG: DUF2332 domain-containing protein [Janthinobacterium lividum]